MGEPMFPHCYVCGQQNARGLQIPFAAHPAGGCVAHYVARDEHVGWPEVIHGGLLFTLMDEAVAWAVIYAGLHGVTARAEAKFRAPVRVGTELVIRGWLNEAPRRVTRARAELRDGAEDGPVIAELDAIMAISRDGRREA